LGKPENRFRSPHEAGKRLHNSSFRQFAVRFQIGGRDLDALLFRPAPQKVSGGLGETDRLGHDFLHAWKVISVLSVGLYQGTVRAEWQPVPVDGADCKTIVGERLRPYNIGSDCVGTELP
jgi:hypothetical protein